MCPTCLLIAGIDGKVQDFWRIGADVCEYAINLKLLAREPRFAMTDFPVRIWILNYVTLKARTLHGNWNHKKWKFYRNFFLLFVWSYTMYTFSPASHPLRTLPPAFFSPASRNPSASYSPGFPPCCPADCKIRWLSFAVCDVIWSHKVPQGNNIMGINNFFCNSSVTVNFFLPKTALNEIPDYLIVSE